MRGIGKIGLAVLAIAPILASGGCGTPPKAPVEDRQSQRPGGDLSYRVRAGDTLYSIAFRAGLDYRVLARWNAIGAPYTIYPGQRLRLSEPPRSGTRNIGKSTGQRSSGTASSPRAASASKPAVPQTVVRQPANRTASSDGQKSGNGQIAKPAKTPATKPAVPATQSAGLAWGWPVQGALLARFQPGVETAKGIKIGGRVGQPVLAAEAGEVVYAGSGLIGYGRLIIVQHNEKYLSAYGHNERLLVREGQRVAKGEKIAEMGKNNADTPMLHFEIRLEGKPQDPLRYLPQP